MFSVGIDWAGQVTSYADLSRNSGLNPENFRYKGRNLVLTQQIETSLKIMYGTDGARTRNFRRDRAVL